MKTCPSYSQDLVILVQGLSQGLHCIHPPTYQTDAYSSSETVVIYKQYKYQSCSWFTFVSKRL